MAVRVAAHWGGPHCTAGQHMRETPAAHAQNGAWAPLLMSCTAQPCTGPHSINSERDTARLQRAGGGNA